MDYNNYLYVEFWEDVMYHRYIDSQGNRKHQFIEDYKPCLYKRTSQKINPSTLRSDNRHYKKSIFQEVLEQVRFDSVYDLYKARNDGDTYYGHEKVTTQFIYDTYGLHGDIMFDINKFNIMNYDIETESDPKLKFPDYLNPINEVISVSTKMFNDDRFVTFGLKDYVKKSPKDIYIKCKDEADLLLQLVRYFHKSKVDIYTGYNIKMFDFNYLIARANKIIGEDNVKYISQYYNPSNPRFKAKEPIKFIKKNRFVPLVKPDEFEGDEFEYELYLEEREKFISQGHFKILGSSICDYYDILDKFFLKNLGNRKLDTFAEYFGVGQKVEYVKEYGSLHKFYNENPQRFYEYNEQDVKIVEDIDKKTNYIFILINIVYMSRSLIEDFAGTLVVWDNYTNMEFLNKGYAIPFKESPDMDGETPKGAWVKEPLVSLFRWVVTLDVESLYPTMLIMFNISPETLLDESKAKYNYYIELRDNFAKVEVPFIDLLDKYLHGIDTENTFDAFFETLQPIDPTCTTTPNRVKTMKAKDGKFGVMAEVVSDIIDKRRKAKSLSKKHASEYQHFKSEGLEDTVEAIKAGTLRLQYYGLEQAQKILINSLYGALLNKYFRYYNKNLGEAITSGGRLYIQSINIKVNQLINYMVGTDNVDYVIYTDTDSHFLNFEDIVSKVFKLTDHDEIVAKIDDFIVQVIEPYYERCFSSLSKILNVSVNRVNMKREKIADIALFRSKKNYAIRVIDNEGVRYSDPEISYVGLENVKGSTPKFFKDVIERSIELMFDHTEDEFIDYCTQVRDDYFKLDIFDIAKSNRVNGIDEKKEGDKGVSAPLKGTWAFNRKLEEMGHSSVEPMTSGEMVRWVYLKKNPLNTYGSESVAFREDSDIELIGLHRDVVDYDTEFDKKFAVVKGLAKIRGWETSEYDRNKYSGFEW